MDCPWDLENKSIYYQLKNVGKDTLNYTAPSIGKNLDIYITAINGTTYHYAGPVTEELPYWENLSPGEISSGQVWFGFKIFRLHVSKIDYTHWKNSTTGESWYFQPGIYRIYAEYESFASDNNYIQDVIVGIWYSNVITFTIE